MTQAAPLSVIFCMIVPIFRGRRRRRGDAVLREYGAPGEANEPRVGLRRDVTILGAAVGRMAPRHANAITRPRSAALPLCPTFLTKLSSAVTNRQSFAMASAR